MEKLSEKQCPSVAEIKKTLVGLGNVLIQAELADSISLQYYSSLDDLTFKCGAFEYGWNPAKPYSEETFNAFVTSVEDFLKQTVKDYEKRIFELECSKAIVEVYFTEKNK